MYRKTALYGDKRILRETAVPGRVSRTCWVTTRLSGVNSTGSYCITGYGQQHWNRGSRIDCGKVKWEEGSMRKGETAALGMG